MSAFAKRVSAVTGISVERMERLAGGDLSEVLRLPGREGDLVAKGGPDVGAEATMLRAIAAAGVPAPAVEAEHDGLLLLRHVENDRIFSPAAWRDVGAAVRRLHDSTGERFGWPADYALGTVALDNRPAADWPEFWSARRLVATAALLDRPWRDRVERLARRCGDLLPAAPPPALLHGDLWSGNILVDGGRLAALIDPACYHGHAEVDLAMLDLFVGPTDDFDEAYGPLETGWRERRPIYQLFPALVHLRLFGAGYAPLADRLLRAVGA